MEEQSPHLVLLDLVLPESDGIDLMKAIFRMADVPVLFVSGYGKDQVIAQAFEQGGHRLHCQALLADGVGGEGTGGPAQVGRPLPGRTVGTLRAGRPDH